MAVCIACGTDNRDKALFCRGCATSMVALAGSSAATASAPAAKVEDNASKGPTQACPACQARNPLVATSCKTCGTSLVPDMVATTKAIPASVAPSNNNAKLVVMVSLALVTTAVGAWWWSAQDASPAPVAVAAAPVIPQTTGLGTLVGASIDATSKDDLVDADAAAVAAAEEQAARIKQQAAAVAAADRTRRIRERREKEARELAAAEQVRAAQAREQLQAEQARRRAEEEARQKLAAAALAAAKPPPPVQTVDMICESSANFIAREMCRNRECKSPAFTRDPVCVRFREVEAANLRQPMF